MSNYFLQFSSTWLTWPSGYVCVCVHVGQPKLHVILYRLRREGTAALFASGNN